MAGCFILDTNVVSELRKPRPNKGCAQWISRQSAHNLYITIITMAEIAQGIFMRPPDDEQAKLIAWFEEDLPRQFANRIRTLDDASVLAYGKIAAQSRKQGLNRSVLDALIAAIAIAHNDVIVTRNQKDFQGLGIKVINPFSA